MTRHQYYPPQLNGPGSRVETEQEVAGLEDLATPFASMEEAHQMVD